MRVPTCSLRTWRAAAARGGDARPRAGCPSSNINSLTMWSALFAAGARLRRLVHCKANERWAELVRPQSRRGSALFVPSGLSKLHWLISVFSSEMVSDCGTRGLATKFADHGRASGTSSANRPNGEHKVHSLDRVRLLVSTLFPYTSRMHGLATTAAMLTCVAVVLNIGPFASGPNSDGLRGTGRGSAASNVMEQPDGSSSVRQLGVDADNPSLHSKSALEPEDISEPVEAFVRASSLSTVELASTESRPARPKDEVGELQVKPQLQDPGSVDPAMQLDPNRVNLAPCSETRSWEFGHLTLGPARQPTFEMAYCRP